MELRERFVTTLHKGGTGTIGDVSPSRISMAAAEVLGADGAGLVMMQDLVRWPVGACDEDSRRAEQVQATVNDGPCLTAAREGRVLAADEADLAGSWPVYYRELREHTPYRATLSFPIGQGHGAGEDRHQPDRTHQNQSSRHTLQAFAALDLYCTRPQWQLHEDLGTVVVEIVDLIAALLLLTGSRGHRDEGLRPSTWNQREHVWTSVGMVTAAGGMTDVDAIAVLRGYAYARGLVLDDVAGQLVTGRLTTDNVLRTDPGRRE